MMRTSENADVEIHLPEIEYVHITKTKDLKCMQIFMNIKRGYEYYNLLFVWNNEVQVIVQIPTIVH